MAREFDPTVHSSTKIMDPVSGDTEPTPQTASVHVLFDNKSTTCTFTSGGYVSDAKKQIAADFGLRAADFYLIWCAKILRDDMAIDDKLVVGLRSYAQIAVKKKL